MLDTDPEFDNHVELLTEACRLNPEFAARLSRAETDEQIDPLVVEARDIINDQADQAFV